MTNTFFSRFVCVIFFCSDLFVVSRLILVQKATRLVCRINYPIHFVVYVGKVQRVSFSGNLHEISISISNDVCVFFCFNKTTITRHILME